MGHLSGFVAGVGIGLGVLITGYLRTFLFFCFNLFLDIGNFRKIKMVVPISWEDTNNNEA